MKEFKDFSDSAASQHDNKYLVLFMDILGFKDMMYRNEKREMESIIAFLYAIREKNSSYEYKLSSQGSWTTGKINLDITSYSDHIIASVPILPEEHPQKNEKSLLFWLFQEFGQFITYVYWVGLNYGIILRGALAVGEMYIDLKQNISLGIPLIEAFDYETKLAIYPRVIISKSLLDYIHSLTQTKQSGDYNYGVIEPLIKRDVDGFFYFNYLHLPFCCLSGEKLNDIKKIIEHHIEICKGKKNLAALAKWRWLETYFNNTLDHWQKKENRHHDIKISTLFS